MSAKETDILIIGAGPVGLFTVFEAGLLGLDCILIDNLDKMKGKYSDKITPSEIEFIDNKIRKVLRF